ncbi:MAG TPA: LysR family transcriptional regulator [Clostridia bacterium]|nr:LysR family transcriptional regulator [Clostridia bacterium]
MLDFRIETFLTACRLLNFTETAKELHITQPAVSQHIRFLEERYQVKLFSYEGKKLCLTEAGVLLRKSATTMMHDTIILRERLQSGARTKRTFGATRTIGDYFIPDTLVRYLEREQNTDLCMLVENTETLLNKIDLGELDFALVEGYFRKSDYDYKVFSEQRFVAVCASNFFSGNQAISLGALFESCLIVRESGSGTREILERYLQEKNGSIADFSRVIEIGSIRAIKSLVAAGCGITFLYEAAVAEELATGTLRVVELEDFSLSNHFTMVWRKNSMFHEQYLQMFDDFFSKGF